MAAYRARARTRGVSFDLTFEEFLEITKSDCYLCGAPPAQIKQGGRRNGQYVYNGIDRVDNTLGYQLDNVMPCCKVCNFLKGELSLPDFKRHVRRIYELVGSDDEVG
jgi:hypothetical protein